MKNNMLKGLAITFFLGGAPNLYASGIPVVDVASIAQAVTGYLNELEQYAEQLAQGITQQE
jgi:hypothetical protein